MGTMEGNTPEPGACPSALWSRAFRGDTKLHTEKRLLEASIRDKVVEGACSIAVHGINITTKNVLTCAVACHCGQTNHEGDNR